MADGPPETGKPLRPYPPEQERLFFGPYKADQVAEEVLAAVCRAVEGLQGRPAGRSPLA